MSWTGLIMAFVAILCGVLIAYYRCKFWEEWDRYLDAQKKLADNMTKLSSTLKELNGLIEKEGK